MYKKVINKSHNNRIREDIIELIQQYVDGGYLVAKWINFEF